MQQARQTAYKVWIANLQNGTYTKQSGEWEPNYVACNNQKISRVNILATVINVTFAENMGAIELDDGSGTLQVRAFKEDVGILRNLSIGDVITVIGRPREFNNTIYVIPEIVKKVDNAAWLTVRKLELQKLFGNPEQVQQKQPPEPVVVTTQPTQPILEPTPTPHQINATESERQKILNIVEKAGETGLAMEALLAEANIPEQEAETIVQELLKDGEIYVPRPGQVKIV